MIVRAKTITSAPQKMALLADNESSSGNSKHVSMHHSERATTASMLPSSPARRRHSMALMLAGASGGSTNGFGAFFSGLFDNGAAAAAADVPRNERTGTIINSGKGPTNEIITSVNGMRHRRLGGSDIVVSELGLGTQRW